jgi:hypothetical protein
MVFCKPQGRSRQYPLCRQAHGEGIKGKRGEIEIARENEINELRAYTDCLEGKMSGVTGTVRGRQLIAMINNCKEMHPSLE